MPSHLSLILDKDAAHEHPQILAFLNSHIALQHENTLAVFAALPGKSVMLYPSDNTPPTPDPNAYLPFKALDAAVIANLAAHLDDTPSDEPSALVGALTKALCYINRLGSRHDPRILILSASPDLSSSYIPIMNAIFSAQKLVRHSPPLSPCAALTVFQKITIDACQIAGPETVFLQQAAHLTGGSYLYLDRRDALLQYLIMAFLPPPAIRTILAVPTLDRVDFRAACFCHKNIIDIGFVCSVCLSIFCQAVPVCSTCRTKFPIKTLKRLNAARPQLLPSAPSTPAPSSATAPRPPPENGFSAHNIRVTNSANTNGSGSGARH
ncbi:hypothetical protein D9619_002025 [Psilocybe cf. subviscida]|uniref:General transcription and DNA repair factor IIH subunit TFB4 n=1 Tax=Psilocybe cf. subviscida TaxID=2480587 RepID=A0A8H5F2N6_9AGAR|nr:hypothetical protein D9619_002025 [Psilocybe cf. subviscida]